MFFTVFHVRKEMISNKYDIFFFSFQILPSALRYYLLKVHIFCNKKTLKSQKAFQRQILFTFSEFLRNV